MLNFNFKDLLVFITKMANKMPVFQSFARAFISKKTTMNIISIRFYIENTNARELDIKF